MEEVEVGDNMLLIIAISSCSNSHLLKAIRVKWVGGVLNIVSAVWYPIFVNLRYLEEGERGDESVIVLVSAHSHSSLVRRLLIAIVVSMLFMVHET